MIMSHSQALVLEFLGLQFFIVSYTAVNILLHTADFIAFVYIPKVELLNLGVWIPQIFGKYFPLNVGYWECLWGTLHVGNL